MNIDVYLSIAEISGVFIAFGVLISAFGKSSLIQQALLRGLVAAGLIVLIASLIPVGLTFYSDSTGSILRGSCVSFLVLIWVVLIGTQNKKFFSVSIEYMKSHVLFTTTLLSIEVFIQVPLFLASFGLLRPFWEAFLVSALLLNLLQAAIFLSHMIFVKSASDT